MLLQIILIFEQDLTHYRASFYDYLSKRIDEEILVLYGQSEPGSHHMVDYMDEKRLYKVQEIKRRWVGNKVYYQSRSLIKQIIKNNDVSCVIHRGAIRNIGLFFEIKLFERHNIPVVLRGIGHSVRRKFDPKKNLVDRIHKKIVDSCAAYLCYTVGSKKILDKFYDEEKIIVAVNTLNSEVLIDHLNSLNEVGKESVKRELKLNQRRYLIHVGRLSLRKKIDVLLDIYSAVKKEVLDIGLIIVGDGPEMDGLKEKVAINNIDDVVFTGSISSESILASKYIYVSDVVVIPGNIGLSANHAFLLGKPIVGHVLPKEVVHPKDYIHGPEHEYLIDGYNGISVPTHDVSAFCQAVIKILNDDKYSENALLYAYKNLTVEEMVKGYLTAIDYARKKSFCQNK